MNDSIKKRITQLKGVEPLVEYDTVIVFSDYVNLFLNNRNKCGRIVIKNVLFENSNQISYKALDNFLLKDFKICVDILTGLNKLMNVNLKSDRSIFIDNNLCSQGVDINDRISVSQEAIFLTCLITTDFCNWENIGSAVTIRSDSLYFEPTLEQIDKAKKAISYFISKKKIAPFMTDFGWICRRPFQTCL